MTEEELRQHLTRRLARFTGQHLTPQLLAQMNEAMRVEVVGIMPELDVRVRVNELDPSEILVDLKEKGAKWPEEVPDPVSELRALSDVQDPHKKAYLLDYIASNIRQEDLVEIASRYWQKNREEAKDSEGEVLWEIGAAMYKHAEPFTDDERCPKCGHWDIQKRVPYEVPVETLGDSGGWIDSSAYYDVTLWAPYYLGECRQCHHQAIIDECFGVATEEDSTVYGEEE